MKQILGNLADGTVQVVEAPRPAVRSGCVLVAVECSVVSSGTERMLLEFGEAPLWGKALRQPERVRQAVERVATEGLAPVADAIRHRLGDPLQLGSAAAGVVVEVGRGVEELGVGQRVCCVAPHAEVVCVPSRWVFRLAAEANVEDAAFAPLGAIALQAVREAGVDVGSVVAVLGLGLLGHLAAGLLRASGCRVIGFDLREDRVQAGQALGPCADRVEVLTSLVDIHTGGSGVDAVLVAAPVSRELLELASRLCRKRAVVVQLGAGRPVLDREAFYGRDLTFKVSHGFGPGRDDPDYESGEVDYPVGLVRWTAGRNIESVLGLISDGRLDVSSISRVRYGPDAAGEAYDRLRSSDGPHAVLFEYSQSAPPAQRIELRPAKGGRGPAVAVLGAGAFATRVLLPVLAELDVERRVVASRGGLDAAEAARKFGFEAATSVVADCFADDVDTVFVATRHDSHVEYAVRALEQGKNLWLEKPLAATREQLTQLESAWRNSRLRSGPPIVMAGFNRRFAATVVRLRNELQELAAPMAITLTVNAGELPAGHWAGQPGSGGRLVGEACHFVDLARFLVGESISSCAVARGPNGSATLTVELAGGSVASVNYFTTGHGSVSKERLEVFVAGRVYELDNCRTLRVHGGKLRDRLRLPASQDKGHASAIKAFMDAVRTGGPSPIDFGESLEVSAAIFDALDDA